MSYILTIRSAPSQIKKVEEDTHYLVICGMSYVHLEN
ncbi:Uncharacterised protein [Helicobacter pametensis]|nr:Uncharacterised protein [Helicobacter pametensis]